MVFEIIMAWSVEGSGDLQNNYIVVDDSPSSQKQPDIVYQNGLFHIVYEDSNSGRVIYRTAGFEEIVNTSSILDQDIYVDISPNPVFKLGKSYF